MVLETDCTQSSSGRHVHFHSQNPTSLTVLQTCAAKNLPTRRSGLNIYLPLSENFSDTENENQNSCTITGDKRKEKETQEFNEKLLDYLSSLHTFVPRFHLQEKSPVANGKEVSQTVDKVSAGHLFYAVFTSPLKERKTKSVKFILHCRIVIWILNIWGMCTLHCILSEVNER